MHFAEIVAIVRDKASNVLMTGLCVRKDIDNVPDDVTIHHTGRYVSRTGWYVPEGINVVVVLATGNLLTKGA